MRTLDRTAKRIIIEVTREEILQKGFDKIWDEVRELYSDKLYDIDTVKNFEGDKLVLITLKLINRSKLLN